MNTPPSAPVPNLARLLAMYEVMEDGNTLLDLRNCGREDRPAQGFVTIPWGIGPDEVDDDPDYPPPKVH